ncbi:MAG: Hpt domain-containing protein [Magnetococcales bacterium]|nr:Hpt domain-containing protein [Magnetococcales bacterium]
MSLKVSLAHHLYAFSLPPHLTVEWKTARAAEEIDRLFASLANARPIERESREKNRERILDHFRQHRSLAGLPLRFLRQAPWFLFETDAEGARPVDDPEFRAAWRAWFVGHATTGTAISLLHNLLLHAPGQEQVAFWKEDLERLLAQGKHPQLAAWKERCERFHLLEPDGPMTFASALYRGEATLHELCQQAGLQGDLATGGFVRRGLTHLLEMMGRYAEKDGLRHEELKTLLHGLRDQQGRFRTLVSGFATRLAEVLLRPFQDREAETKLRNMVRDFLLGYLGDPRTHPAAWQGVPPEARAVILAWLAGRPKQIDDKLRLFIQEANRQLADLETDLYQMQSQGQATPDPVLQRAMQRLHGIVGVAEFFNLFDVIELSHAMETTLGGLRARSIPWSAGLPERLIREHGELREQLNALPGMVPIR